MSRTTKIICLAISLPLLLATTGCAPALVPAPPAHAPTPSVKFGSEEELKRLIAAHSLPQLPQNLDFQKQYNTRLKELIGKVIDWPATPPELEIDTVNNQIYILSGEATIPAIYQQFGEDVIEDMGQGEYLLKSAIIIDGGYLEMEAITLRLDVSASTFYKGYRGPISIELRKGFLRIRQSVVSSWDQGAEARFNPDKQRPFIWATGKGGECYVEIRDSELSHLGSTKREVAPGILIPPQGPWGLSFYHATFVKVTNSEIHHNYMGLFFYDVKGALVHKSQIHDNASYGIDVHDDSEGSLFSENRIWNNGNHGLILSKRCTRNIIARNVIYDHTSRVKDYFIHGIMLHESSNDNLVWDNTLWNNYNGINIHASHNTVVAMNSILSDREHGIKLWAVSNGNLFLMNSVQRSNKYDIRIESSSQNVFLGSSIEDGGISFTNSAENVFIIDAMPKVIRNGEGNILIEHENPLAYYLDMYER